MSTFGFTREVTESSAVGARIFFGYPSRPNARRTTVSAAAAQIQRMANVTTRTWEQLEGASGFIIDDILPEMDAAQVAVFEVTDLNENVMFEVGYAIGARRSIWLIRDPSFKDAERNWRQMRLLTTVRFAAYTSSDDIRIAFLNERPDLRERIIFDEMIGPSLQPEEGPTVFYLRSFYDTDSARSLTRRIHEEQDRGLRVVDADPRESSFESLSWYAQQIYSSSVVIAHFDDPNRRDATIHNARLALVCGVARGMGKPLLMLSEEAYLAPIDYRDLLFVYGNAQIAASRADTWLREKLATAYGRLQELERRTSRLKLATELRSLRLGEHVAEYESDVLEEYFLRTTSYEEVLRSRTTVFVGRKGTGKSANAIEAARELGVDRRNLVCFIKPYAYELSAVTALLRKYRQRDEKGFVVESLWKFLLYTEVALAAYRAIHGRVPGASRTGDEDELVTYLDDAEFLTVDFAVRLERTIDGLLDLPLEEQVSRAQSAISERLHSRIIGELRRRLVAALSDKVRVAIVIDNLDRAWQRGPEAAGLAEFLLGLVVAAEQLEAEVRREADGREPLLVTVAIFLRSDIFSEVAAAAPEPDKLPVSRLNWSDSELRLQVLEERYIATREGSALPDELWERYFCDRVRGVPVREYMTWRTLPRPRDLLYLANGAIIAAVNHRSPKVEERDILAGEQEYSQFALEALEVEASGEFDSLIDVLFGFIGTPAVLEHAEVESIVKTAGVAERRLQEAISYLRSLTFLGVQIGDGEFGYAEETWDLAKADVLASRYSAGASMRYAVHPAFRPYLEIEDADLPPGQLELG